MAEQQESQTTSKRTRHALGPLEARVMDALWSSDTDMSVQEVCQRLGPKSNYKTVMTVLNRLVDKDLLERNLAGRAYRYQPHQARGTYLRAAADDLVNGYMATYGQESAQHLADAVHTTAPHTAPARTGSNGLSRPPGAEETHRSPSSSAAPERRPESPLNPLTVALGAAVIVLSVLLVLQTTRRRR